MGNFIYYEKLEDYEEQLKKAKLCDEKDQEIERLNNIIFNQNKRNSHQRIANDNLQNKNKELNNIINELETKLLNVCSTYISNDEVLKMAKYIRELKGSNK